MMRVMMAFSEKNYDKGDDGVQRKIMMRVMMTFQI